MSNFVLEYKPHKFICMDSIIHINDVRCEGRCGNNQFNDKPMYLSLIDGTAMTIRDRDIQDKIRKYFTTI